MKTAAPQLLTPGRIATLLGVALHRVQHVLPTRHHIAPIARAGNVRLYDRETLANIRRCVAGGDYLVHRHVAQFVGHQQVDQVVNVWQPPTVEPVDRHFAVETQLVNVLSRFGHDRRIGVEAAYEETSLRKQRARQLPVATTEVNDQAAVEPRGRQDVFGAVGRLSGRWRQREEARKGNDASDHLVHRDIRFGLHLKPFRAYSAFYLNIARPRV